MAYVQLTDDKSYNIYLSTATKPTVNVPNGRTALEVDTGIWYVFYEGTWYPQNEATV